MLTLIRSDWFPTMLAGFALGGLALGAATLRRRTP